MPELIIGLILLVVAGALVAFGMLLGRVLFRDARHDTWEPFPTRESDLAATSRTIQRLANDGVIDEELRAKLFELLRESRVRHEHIPITSVEPAAPQPSPEPSIPSAASIEEPAADVTPDAEVPVTAEIVAEAPAPEPPHPLDAPEPVTAPTPSRPQQRRRALADVMQAFMQDKNIRWGELVSGVLIVGCSIALVISLRREIESLSEQFIYLPALLFMLATAAIHGAGNYTLRRWNLQSTSRGVLIIATLLIPINFLAAIIVTGPESRQLPPFHPLYLSAVTVGVAAFGAMAYFAGQALMREGSWRLLVGVMGTSVGQLLINRLIDHQSTAFTANLLVSIPLLAYLVSTIGQLRVATRRPRVGLTLGTETLLVLGITSFALAAPIGLLLSRSDSVRTALSWLSTPLSLPAVVILATGLALHRRVLSRRLATLRTVGTSLALTGGVMMLVALLLAWPEPPLLITVGLFSFTSLTLLAAVGRLPALHVPAIACCSLAVLVAFHLLQGSFAGYEADLPRRLWELFLMGRSSVALTVLAVVAGGAAGLLLKQGRRLSGLSYLAGCGGIACLATLIAIVVGFWGTESHEANVASPVLLFYAFAVLVASYFAPTTALTWIGSTLLLVGFVHGCGWNTTIQHWLASASLLPSHPVLVATLAHGIAAAITACLFVARGSPPTLDTSSRRWQQLVLPLTFSGLLSSLLALPTSVLVRDQQFGEHAWYAAALSLIWLGATVVQRSPLNFSVFQTLATIAVMFTTASVCQQQTWWDERLYLPQHLQAQLGTLAVWCLVWSVGRRLTRQRWPSIVGVMRWNGQAVDELVLGGTVLGMLVMCVIGCGTGAGIELGFAEAAKGDSAPTWHAVFAIGSWIALMLLLAATIGSLVERFSLQAFSGLFAVAATAALLVGGGLYETLAVASGLRWSFAIAAVGLTVAICLGSRIEDALRRLTWLEWDGLPSELDRLARSWTLSLSAIPILGLTTANLVQAAAGNAPNGPSPKSAFTVMGSELSFGIPLGLLTAVLITHAVREKKTSLMLAGSGVFLYLVNLAYFLPILRDPTAALDWPVTIGCMQWNSVGLAVYALGWIGMRRWLESRDDDTIQLVTDPYLLRQRAAVVWALAIMTGLASVVIVFTPDDLADFADLGSWLSYTACLLSVAAVAWPTQSRAGSYWISLLFGFVCAIGGPLAISLQGTPGSWRAFHILMLVWSTVAIAATALAWTTPRWRRQKQLVTTSVQWASAFMGLSVFLALRATPFDPQTPWWSFGVTLGAALVAGALGFRTRRQTYAYTSALLAALAVTIVWWEAWPNGGLQGVVELVQLNLIAVVVASLVWLFAELTYQFRSRRHFDRFSRAPAVHRVAAVVVSVISFVIVALGFVVTGVLGVARSNVDIANLTGWILLPLLVVLLVGSLWDQRTKPALPMLYTWGVMAALMTLDEVDEQVDFDTQTVFVVAALALAAYVSLTGHLWRYGANLAALGEHAGIPDPVSRLKRTSVWLPIVTLLITAMIALAELAVVLAFRERWMRVSAAFAPLLLAYGVACQAQQQRRTLMQHASLMLVGLAAVYAVWADIEPGWRQTFVLERAVRVLMVLAGLAFLYAIPLSRWTKHRGGDWFPVVRRAAVHCGVAAIVALSVVLVMELSFFERGVGVPFGHPYQVVAVAIVLVGLIIAFLALALSPERDPLSLSEQGRTAYVYAAQIIGALLFAHLYLSHPQLFGRLQPYWPYIVMGIAFAGVGVGELFQRSDVRVMAEPLQRTGGFLPLLPALGWWLNRELGIDTAGHYSLLLFFVGLLYVALSMLRRSYISGVAAALAGNAALWALLADYEPLSLLKHPQFWLIPPAVSTLVATQINRRHFSEAQLAGIRYLCLLIIYVSSTADIFIERIGDSLWEPMVLATLSVIGVFVGIALQIRAFLYLGATFVLLSVVSMVWHAYANIRHVGIWWGFGILLGLLILTIFGIFEKKRPELMRVVEGMRKWEH